MSIGPISRFQISCTPRRANRLCISLGIDLILGVLVAYLCGGLCSLFPIISPFESSSWRGPECVTCHRDVTAIQTSRSHMTKTTLLRDFEPDDHRAIGRHILNNQIAGLASACDQLCADGGSVTIWSSGWPFRSQFYLSGVSPIGRLSTRYALRMPRDIIESGRYVHHTYFPVAVLPFGLFANGVVLAASLRGLRFTLHWTMSILRKSQGRCPACGYQLPSPGGAPRQAGCPECGKGYAHQSIAGWSKQPRGK
jgi:hypothetical protein